jgi:Flp pilus assembly protein TadG
MAAWRVMRQCGRRGAVSLEFAVTATAFLILTFGAMELGYDYFVQAALDNAVNLAARGVQVGANQKGTNQTGPQFVQQSVCPDLGGLLNCGQLFVAVTPITTDDYYDYFLANPPSLSTVTGTGGGSSGSADPVNTGVACQPMVVEAYYLGPTFLGTLIPQFSQQSPLNSSQLVHVTYAAAGFINENFGGGTGC